jgi:hypothetical protein
LSLQVLVVGKETVDKKGMQISNISVLQESDGYRFINIASHYSEVSLLRDRSRSGTICR